MRKFVSILLLSLSIITLIACTKNKQQYLDGEYYWISSERNELAFTIKGNRDSPKKRNPKQGEVLGVLSRVQEKQRCCS